MPHLTLEALARLVDEAAEPHEAAHLQSCIPCRRELEEMREQTVLLADLDTPELPAGGWDALEARLLAEGLIREAAAAPTVPVLRLAPATPAPAPRAWWRHPGMRAAAAVAVFLAGGVAGASLWGGRGTGDAPSGVEGPLAGPVPETTPEISVAAAPDAGPAYVGPERVEQPTARLASAGGGAARATPRPRRTGPAVEAARRQLEDAEAQYVAALQRYAALADAEDATPEERLRALDGLVATTREALDRSPADPVLNGYHMAAVRERESVFRQVAQQAESTWF